MINILDIADSADVIVNGYAFKNTEIGIRVLNLNKPEKASLFSKSGEILETSMDDIELGIVHEYLMRNLKYMEV